ncbi:hypothetical protein [Nostoc sp. TCL26-01]|uniref:hypothetical protein n=1 Tax=Nostoc sp. TCL26-01 TaxID=2576904 RepID=UPI002118831C|nr:hypothetical protein [Nostoc sp. TCL26-01]
MQDQSIEPDKRLAWGPCAVPFIMSFGELNKRGFRDEDSSDPLQLLINNHTEEDDHHWLWFLSDLEKLGFDNSLTFTDSIKFLWSEETMTPRWVVYQLFRYALEATPIQKLVIIEVLESTGNIVFANAAQVAHQLQSVTGNKYLYFGDFHLAVETGHTTGSSDIEEVLANIQLTEIENQAALVLADKVFDLITELVNSLFVYAIGYCDRQQLVA